jgi:hypothetical protein
MGVLDKVEAIKMILEDAMTDSDKADNGNKAAGTRVRKAMQEVIAVAKDARKEVLSKR